MTSFSTCSEYVGYSFYSRVAGKLAIYGKDNSYNLIIIVHLLSKFLFNHFS